MNKSQAIDHLRQVLRRQHKALATEDSYVFWVGRYIDSLLNTPTALPSEKKLEIFLTGLALRHNVAASTQNQAFNAVVFFYKQVLGQPLGNVDALRAKRPVHERHAPSISDTRQLLETIRNVGGYATHCLQRGTNPRAIQEAMGHKSLETTMGYLHAEALSVQSPLEALQ